MYTLLVWQIAWLILLESKPVYNLLQSMFLLFCQDIFFPRHAHHKSHRVKCGPGVALLSFQFQTDYKMFFFSLIRFKLLGWLATDGPGVLDESHCALKRPTKANYTFEKNLSSIWYDVYDHPTYVVWGINSVFHVLIACNFTIRFVLFLL